MTLPKKRGGRSRGYFPKVAEARQIFADEAVELYKLYKQIAIEALAAQEFITAEKAIAYLLAHVPEDEDSGTLLNADVDKNKNPEKNSAGPSIQIGLALGGMPTQTQQALPSISVVEIKGEQGEPLVEESNDE